MTYLFILIGYALLMIALGALAARGVQATSDFFVAGRGLSAGLICSTLLAANIGAGSTVGATGLGFRDGWWAWWWVGSAGIGSLILAFTVGPKIWRVAHEHNLYTVGDYLEFRYSRAVRGIAALLLWCGALAILAGQLIAAAWLLNVIVGTSKPVGCLIAATVITIYFALGGLHATARVNVIQLAVKLLGFVVALLYLLSSFTGFNCMVAEGRPAEFNRIGVSGVLRYLAILVPAFVISPGLLQKVFGARDERAARNGVLLNAVGLLLFAAIPVMLGMIVRWCHPELGNRELALPTLLTKELPFWLGALLLAAVFSAELSAADAVLFMLSTSLSKDLYQTFIKPQVDDKRLLFVARLTAVVCGALGAGLGILFESVIAALTVFYTLLSAALLLPLLAGLYTRRVRERAALATMIVSVIVTFTLERLTAGQGVWGVPSLLWGAGAGLIVMALVSLLEKGDPKF